MKVEIISIGTQLLVSDILDTNTAHVSRSLNQVKVNLTCKVTVGEDLTMIADTIRVALRRADVVITLGGIGPGEDNLVCQAIAAVTERPLLPDLPYIAEAKVLGDPDCRMPGLRIVEPAGTLFCLPGNRRELAYLLELEVLPYIRQQLSEEKKSGWMLLRTVGVMESSLKQKLVGLTLNSNQRITFDSFAGQANVRLWVEADTEEEVARQLQQLKQTVLAFLGDQVYGQGEDRLEKVVFQELKKSGRRLAMVECHTDQVLAEMLGHLPGAEEIITAVPATSTTDLAADLQIEDVTPESDLVRWCRTVAERLLVETASDLGLVIYKSATQGGVQILVTLASPHGVSVTNRSFGGHPDHINQWAGTLALAHLRRWLLAHN